MLIKTRGIVFRAIKYRESSLILDVYTEARGLRKYIVSGVRSARSRTSPGLLQVMSLLEVVAYERDDRDMHRLKEVRPAFIFQSVPFDVQKGTVGLFMAELARKTIREQEENARLFDFLFRSFVHLDTTRESVGNIHLHFMLELSTFLGFMPSGEYSAETPLFDLQEGSFVPDLPGHSHFLHEEKSRLLHELLEVSMSESHRVRISRAERQALLNDLLTYFRLHIENLPEIHSHRILREVMK